ncbi:predicted protein [Postia placenta Mad-698-R]|nr:predicted protein [Postia placenta Mad-698-R]
MFPLDSLQWSAKGTKLESFEDTTTNRRVPERVVGNIISFPQMKNDLGRDRLLRGYVVQWHSVRMTAQECFANELNANYYRQVKQSPALTLACLLDRSLKEARSRTVHRLLYLAQQREEPELARRLVRLLEPVVAEVEDVVVAGAPQDGYGHQSKLDVEVVIAAVGMAVACLAK